MKGKHWCKPVSLKNWKTGEILNFNSQKEFCKEYDVPVQVCSDIVCGRRKYYRQFCLPNYPVELIKRFRIKNLKNDRVYEYYRIKDAARLLRLSYDIAQRLVHDKNYRHKHYSHVDWNDYDSIPKVINKCNGSISIIYSVRDFVGNTYNDNKKDWKKLHYLIKNKRIPTNNQFTLNGERDYKYLILNKNSGKIYTALKLKDFCMENDMRPETLYRRNKDFEVIEG